MFIIPAVLGLLFFRLGPVFASFYLSLTKYEIITAPQWIGFANYTKLVKDALWLRSIEVTLWYVTLFVPLSLTFAYAVALLMSRNVRGITTYRTLWYLPSVVPVVASATIWRWGLNPEFGPINYPLKVLGLPAPWLTDPMESCHPCLYRSWPGQLCGSFLLRNHVPRHVPKPPNGWATAGASSAM